MCVLCLRACLLHPSCSCPNIEQQSVASKLHLPRQRAVDAPPCAQPWVASPEACALFACVQVRAIQMAPARTQDSGCPSTCSPTAADRAQCLPGRHAYRCLQAHGVSRAACADASVWRGSLRHVDLQACPESQRACARAFVLVCVYDSRVSVWEWPTCCLCPQAQQEALWTSLLSTYKGYM